MNYKNSCYLLLFFLFFSCVEDKKIFEINNFDELLFLVKSTKISKINKKEKSILTFNERTSSNHFYKKLETIYENENFKAVILLSQKQTGRHYHFLVRTINKKNNKVIDTFLLSSFNEDTKEFCSGFVSSNLKVSRTCKHINFTLEKQIDTFGHIIQLNN